MKRIQFLASCVLLCQLTILFGCKVRNDDQQHSSFLAGAQASSICEDLSAFVANDGVDYEAELKREMARVSFREDFDNITDILNEARRDKTNKPAAKDLSVAEIAAILAYTNAGYEDINSSLWTKKCADFKMTARILASGINRSIGVRGAVYRGGTISQADLDNKVYEVGNTVVAPAFSSSSLDRTVAERFARNAFFEIEDATGGYVRPLSSWGNEDEVTFVPGTKFRVEGVQEVTAANKPTFYKVKLTLVSPPAQQKVFEYHPKAIDKAVLAASGDKAVTTLIDFLRVIAPQRAVSGHLEYDQNVPCTVSFAPRSDGYQISSKAGNTEKSLILEESGKLIAGTETYQPNRLWTHVDYRIPDYPAVVYHLTNNVNGVEYNAVSIYLGLENAQLAIERVGISTPSGANLSVCVFKN